MYKYNDKTSSNNLFQTYSTYITVCFMLFFSGFFVSLPCTSYADDDVDKQIQQLNTQIQTQLQQIQALTQKQITTVNTQIQSQIQQMQADVQKQIATMNTQTQSQLQQLQISQNTAIQKLQTDTQAQMKTLQDNFQGPCGLTTKNVNSRIFI